MDLIKIPVKKVQSAARQIREAVRERPVEPDMQVSVREQYLEKMTAAVQSYLTYIDGLNHRDERKDLANDFLGKIEEAKNQQGSLQGLADYIDEKLAEMPRGFLGRSKLERSIHQARAAFYQAYPGWSEGESDANSQAASERLSQSDLVI